MPNIEPFEKYSDEYDNWFDYHIDFYQAEFEAIRRLMPPAGANGVEVGAGSGKFAIPLGIRIGVEPSEKMARKARLRGVDVFPGIAEELPFYDELFDFVVMVTTICFVDDVVKSFREALRVLKPGGFVIVGFVDRESELGRKYIEKEESSKFYKNATFFSATEVLQYLKESGFTVTNVLQTLIHGESPKTILEGFGKGAFIVVKGMKMGTANKSCSAEANNHIV